MPQAEEDAVAWVIGIDEAGYGPNLGPFVQVAAVLPAAGRRGADPWQRLMRPGEGEPAWLADSKRLYPQEGREGLERRLAAVLGWSPQPWGERLAALAPAEDVAAAQAEPWFDPAETVPATAVPPLSLPPGVPRPRVRVRLVVPAVFNRLCQDAGNKAELVLHCWRSLLRQVVGELAAVSGRGADEAELAVCVQCDRLGGRRYYGPLLLETFPDSWVVPLGEGAEVSRYRVERPPLRLAAVFQVRAEAASPAVALASMLAKWVREVWMGQFNRFWVRRVAGLRPTAGYPLDARRFYREIAPLLPQVGLTVEQVWRTR